MERNRESRRPAVFLDRDGTLVYPRHYPSSPQELVVVDRVAEPLRALQALNYLLVVITNQSGIARGFFTEHDLENMHVHLRAMLASLGVHLDGIYHCPHSVEGIVPHLSIACDCRKPRPGMLLQAANDLQIDLEASWFLGDILDDVEAGNRAGCNTVLIDLGTESPPDSSLRRPSYVARDTAHALNIVLADRDGSVHDDLDYLPHRWLAAEAKPRQTVGSAR